MIILLSKWLVSGVGTNQKQREYYYRVGPLCTYKSWMIIQVPQCLLDNPPGPCETCTTFCSAGVPKASGGTTQRLTPSSPNGGWVNKAVMRRHCWEEELLVALKTNKVPSQIRNKQTRKEDKFWSMSIGRKIETTIKHLSTSTETSWWCQSQVG